MKTRRRNIHIHTMREVNVLRMCRIADVMEYEQLLDVILNAIGRTVRRASFSSSFSSFAFDLFR